jgi:peptidoglycan/LPS O-acetylase OafA/YrhL
MERRFELDILRATALFLLFVFHTNLNVAYPNQLWTIGTYMLGAFFFVSGMLFVPSIERHTAKSFLKNKLFRIYIPFLLMLVLYFVLFAGPLQAYVYHATGLSIFHILQSGALNLFHMWYVVHLLAYFLLFLAVYRLIKSDARRSLVVAGIFLLLVLLWAINSPLRLEWKFGAYLLVFYAGTVVGNNIDRVYDLIKKRTIFLLVLTLLTGFMVLIIPENVPTYTDMVLFIFMRSAFAISACLLSLRIFLRMGKIRKAATFISSGSLFAYLLQPAVSNAVSCAVTDNCSVLGAWGTLDMTSTLAMIPVSFLIAILLARGIQACYNAVLKKIKV